MAMTATLLAAFSGSTVRAAGFTTVLSNSHAYVGACKKIVHAGVFGSFWAVDTIVTTNAIPGVNTRATAVLYRYNSSGNPIGSTQYDAANGSWGGGTYYAAYALLEDIAIWASSSYQPGFSPTYHLANLRDC